MSAALRLASGWLTFGYFAFLPVQRLVNGIGLGIMCVTLPLALLSRNPDAGAGLAALGLVGAVIGVLTPATAGGMAFRYASSPAILHLRPHGRARMLQGATLAITLVAALVTLPMLVLQHVVAPRPPPIQPLTFFLAVWSFTAAMWIAMFALSFSLLGPMAGLLLPLSIFAFWKMDLPAPDVWIVFPRALLAWAAFAIWYLNAHRIGRPALMGYQSPPGPRDSVASISEQAGPEPRDIPRHSALRHYLLGSDSPLGPVVAGAMPALMLLLTTRLVMPEQAWARFGPQFLLGMFTAIMPVCGALAYRFVRRARLLWLRAGLDRATLFGLAERHGLPAVLLMLGAAAAILVTAALADRPDVAHWILLYAVLQFIAGACVFYCGLSMTQDSWTAVQITLCVGVGALLLMQTGLILRPGAAPVAATAAAVALDLPVACVLRWYARRRWLGLDWRVAKLPAMPGRPM